MTDTSNLSEKGKQIAEILLSLKSSESVAHLLIRTLKENYPAVVVKEEVELSF